MTLVDNNLEEQLKQTADTWQTLREISAGASRSPADYVGTIEQRQKLEEDLEAELLKLGSRLVQAFIQREEAEETSDNSGAPPQPGEQDTERDTEEVGEPATVSTSADTVGLPQPSNDGTREETSFVEQKIEVPSHQFSFQSSLDTLSAEPKEASEPSPRPADLQPSLTAAISRERSQMEESESRRETDEQIAEGSEAVLDSSPAPRTDPQPGEPLNGEVESRSDEQPHQPTPTAEQLEQFKTRMNNGEFGAPDSEPADADNQAGTTVTGYLPPETFLFPELKEEMEPVPDHINDARALELEIGTCQTVADERHRTKWRELEDDIHRTLMGLTVARMRRAQAVGPEYHHSSYVNERLSPVFRALTRHSEAYRPGYVHGLSKSHDPERGTWDRDIAAWKDQLDELAREYYGADPSDQQGPSREDIDRALTSLRDAFEAGTDEEGIREMVVPMVRSYFDEQTLGPDNDRLHNLLDGHAEWFDDEEFPKLRHALETRRRDEAGRDDSEARFGSVAEALAAADEKFDELHVWKSAHKSADRSNYEDPDRVYRTLEAIATVGDLYFNTASRGRSMGGSWGDMLQKHAHIPIKYSAGEHQTTATMYGEERHFTDPDSGKERTIERHVTVGQAKASSLQIFFAPSERDGEQVVDIGHCGPHLSFVSSNS